MCVGRDFMIQFITWILPLRIFEPFWYWWMLYCQLHKERSSYGRYCSPWVDWIDSSGELITVMTTYMQKANTYTCKVGKVLLSTYLSTYSPNICCGFEIYMSTIFNSHGVFKIWRVYIWNKYIDGTYINKANAHRSMQDCIMSISYILSNIILLDS